MRKIYAFWFYFILIIILSCSLVAFAICIINYDESLKYIDLYFGLSAASVAVDFSLILLKLQCIEINYDASRISFRSVGFGNWKTIIGIDGWNNNVYMPDVENVEVVVLKKKDRTKLLGSRYVFHKYLKIKVGVDTYKYFYVSMFSKKQITELISIMNTNSKLPHQRDTKLSDTK